MSDEIVVVIFKDKDEAKRAYMAARSVSYISIVPAEQREGIIKAIEQTENEYANKT